MTLKNDIESTEHDTCRDSEGGIDYALFLSVVWRDKFLIVFLCVLFSLSAYGISLTIPNKYMASVILVPAQKDAVGQLGGISSQYGGLAAMAGISLGKDSDKSDQAVVLLRSWPFIESVIAKYDLGADVLAASGFDWKKKHILYDSSIYDEIRKEWVYARFEKTNGKPSSWMLYKKFTSLLDVQSDKKSGMVTIKIVHVSPIEAKKWLEILIKELNSHFQLLDKEDAEKNIAYLDRKISDTPIAEMQNVFFSMIESQMKVLMLTERSDSYLFKVLVPPMLPEQKESPRRFMIAVFGFFIGLMAWGSVAGIKSLR